MVVCRCGVARAKLDQILQQISLNFVHTRSNLHYSYYMFSIHIVLGAPTNALLHCFQCMPARLQHLQLRQDVERLCKYSEPLPPIAIGYSAASQVKSKSGEWHTTRLDMEVPGAVLLRDGKGNVFALETEGLVQVDLSDDFVLFMMFADGEWESEMQPVDVEDEAGKTKQLALTDKEFREVIGILKADEESEQPSKK